ncbi:hypothetical protein Avbf_15052, partial [Armadillidium vulgare]
MNHIFKDSSTQLIKMWQITFTSVHTFLPTLQYHAFQNEYANIRNVDYSCF